MIHIYFIYISGLIACCLLIVYAYRRFSSAWSLKHLFKEFNRKIWMTVFLGILFFGLYFLFAILSPILIRPLAKDLLLFASQHPVELVYGGLSLFAFLSLSIYLARMVIKYFYLTRGKDS